MKYGRGPVGLSNPQLIILETASHRPSVSIHIHRSTFVLSAQLMPSEQLEFMSSAQLTSMLSVQVAMMLGDQSTFTLSFSPKEF